LFSPKRPNQLWGPPGLPCSGYGGSFPGVKRPEREVNRQSPASSAEVKNKWSYGSAPPIRLNGQGQLCLVKILPAASASALPSTHPWLSGTLSLVVKRPELESDTQLYSLASLTTCGTKPPLSRSPLWHCLYFLLSLRVFHSCVSVEKWNDASSLHILMCRKQIYM
jgi:hypothetical protein